jgi:DNA-binding transcriptional LysR family regulator
MDLRQLEYVVAVAEEASFTRAAARAHVSQPGISAQVRRLEEELGEPLFDRSGRTVTPTAAGAAVLPFARAALSAAASARAAVEDLAGLVRGRVSVGMVTACPVELMPAAVAGFHREYPDVEISLVEDDSDGLLADVATGRIDIALVGLADDPPAGIAVQVIADEPLHAAVAPGHELATRSSVTLRALAEHDLIALPRGTGGRTALEASCARAGIAPRIVIEASDPRVLAAMAQRGLGVAVLPDSGWEDLILLAIVRPELRSRLALAWREAGPASPAARALIAFARAAPGLTALT